MQLISLGKPQNILGASFDMPAGEEKAKPLQKQS